MAAKVLLTHLKEAIEVHRQSFIKAGTLNNDARPKLLNISEKQNVETPRTDLTTIFKVDSYLKKGLVTSCFTIDITGIDRQALFVEVLTSIRGDWQEDHGYSLTTCHHSEHENLHTISGECDFQL